ncbi:MAG: 9-O-acetyl-N-acetylneuraminate esterase [Ruminococcus sp.]|nr:9-O-acetyl-N-acetylneuraminate esterase [Ruminococcus sp.]
MQKVFNVTGNCTPGQHYMVDLASRLDAIKNMVDAGKYITVNRARQYGKTTTLIALEQYLADEYYVLNMDFQSDMSSYQFKDENSFSCAFAKSFIFLMKNMKITSDIKNELTELKKELNNNFVLVDLFMKLSDICRVADKPVVLIIDEVDSASNNQVFLDFLAQLRGSYLRRNKFPAFHSVILAGVYDIRNLQIKIRPDTEHKHNSPWNIANALEVDMSFCPDDIEGMLSEYESDYHTGMDIKLISQMIYDYTAGYPVLVSQICKFIDEDTEMKWNKNGVKSAVKKLLIYQSPLFESLANKLEQYPELRQQLVQILERGKKIPYRPDDEATKQTVMFGFAKEQNGDLVIANRIFETRFYDMLLTTPQIQNSPLYIAGERQKPEFVLHNRLNMELVLEKFVQYFNDIYGDKTERFIEDDGRKLFLIYLRPIINGVGNYYIEAQTRDLTRTDVIVDYLGEQFVIEMKIWHGKEYNERGERQLAEYLDYYHINKGYMLSFNFNKNKQSGTHTIQLGEKTIFEAIV